MILVQIHYKLSHGQGIFPIILSQNGQNDFECLWTLYSIPAESITGCMFGANLVIPAQIGGKLSQATTIPLQPERPRVKHEIVLNHFLNMFFMLSTFGRPVIVSNGIGYVE